jgi:RNA polymerase sigma-70 factor (ECF subfamily)
MTSPGDAEDRPLPALVLRSQSDRQLAALARRGHEAAFTTLLARHQAELAAHARRLVDAGQVDDVLQQAALSAWTALTDGANVREPRAWLHRIVRNTALRSAARAGDAVALDDDAATVASAETVAVGRLQAREALAAVAGLPQRQRDALVLVGVLETPGSEAAEALGVEEGALRQLVFRARSALRRSIGVLVPIPLLGRMLLPVRSAVAGAGSTARRAALLGGGAAAAAASVLAAVALHGTAPPARAVRATAHEGAAGVSPALRSVPRVPQQRSGAPHASAAIDARSRGGGPRRPGARRTGVGRTAGAGSSPSAGGAPGLRSPAAGSHQPAGGATAASGGTHGPVGSRTHGRSGSRPTSGGGSGPSSSGGSGPSPSGGSGPSPGGGSVATTVTTVVGVAEATVTTSIPPLPTGPCPAGIVVGPLCLPIPGSAGTPPGGG